MTLLRVENLSCGYGGAALVDGISFELSGGDSRVIVGPNGSGKSTLLKTICASIPAIRGSVSVGGRSLAGLPEVEKARLVTMLMQIQPLDPGLTVEELVRLGRTPHLGRWGHLTRNDLDAVERSIDLCRLGDLRHARLSRMSGGERQRARLAMVLAQETPLILLDEPTNHLDVEHRYLLHRIVEKARDDGSRAILMVSHSLEDARRFADSTILVNGGKVRHFGPGEHEDLRRSVAEISGVPSDWVY